MISEEPNGQVDARRADLMRERIIKLEKHNIKTNKSTSDKEMVVSIKKIIREEADSNVD